MTQKAHAALRVVLNSIKLKDISYTVFLFDCQHETIKSSVNASQQVKSVSLKLNIFYSSISVLKKTFQKTK